MKSLHKPEVWEKVLKESESRPVLIYKHSSTCSSSTTAHNEIKNLERGDAIAESLYILIVQNASEISDLVEKDLDVKHETPQVIIIRDREAVYNADHDDINSQEIARHLVGARGDEE